jgi:hypothetical protein
MVQDTSNHSSQSAFPPPGCVTNHEAARMLGVSGESMLMRHWKWHAILHAGAKTVRHPNGGRCNIYSLDAIERVIAAREAASVPAIPDGFVDKRGACEFFGITRFVWKTWTRQGKVRCGVTIPAYKGARRTIYRVEDLHRLKQELFGEDKVYKAADNLWHIPSGYIGREEAWDKFGVQKVTWERWEREGKITCGQRVPGGPKLYRIEDIERMLDEYGKWAPPYPDPDRPGVYRVPLSGRDIKRCEALIDADSLPLIEGGSCHLAGCDEGNFVSLYSAEGVHVPLRRLIMGVAQTGFNVRHVNKDFLDCRRENLVVRTPKQRCWNARKRKTVNGVPCSSRFKGVYWHKGAKLWYVRITWQGKVRMLGRFRDEIAAGLAYDEAARLWYGEHAWLNFPDGVDAWLEAEAARAERAQAA